MARYTGAVCRLCRREGTKLFLKGERCYTDKCSFERRPYAPGQHGQGRLRQSNYRDQLREKQKVKRIYGVLERQFLLYFEKADRMRGVTGENLLSLLEKRLDSVVYRMGMATSRSEARQLVRHNHFTVNGRKVNIPSYQVRVNDVIEVKERSRKVARIKEAVEGARHQVSWVDLDKDNFKGTFKAEPVREELTLPIEEQLIVELYSK
ncbi:30S ribosomal protein S4 [Myxococcota bacterium]|nr:30S ribosomal protein S4 [Myxococcota bacterium]MBU1430949.1 30S ribosomal protein S4 [Myxococcota bacterium]MBU1897256.1 30S ribosomal protein S4 [Myxococcota bacterium]